jgi:hypothetical protein
MLNKEYVKLINSLPATYQEAFIIEISDYLGMDLPTGSLEFLEVLNEGSAADMLALLTSSDKKSLKRTIEEAIKNYEWEFRTEEEITQDDDAKDEQDLATEMFH